MDLAQDQSLKFGPWELIDGKIVAWIMSNEQWNVHHAMAPEQAKEPEALTKLIRMLEKVKCYPMESNLDGFIPTMD